MTGRLRTLAALVRRADPFRALPDSALETVLDMLSGRYPSDAFAELNRGWSGTATPGRWSADQAHTGSP